MICMISCRPVRSRSCAPGGDGVLEDTEVEYQRRWSMVLAGKLKIEKFYAWYFGCTEEEAKEYIPEETHIRRKSRRRNMAMIGSPDNVPDFLMSVPPVLGL